MLLDKTGGMFVTLEGGEGAGKSSQAAYLAEQLEADGFRVYKTREPGGTPAAEALRHLLLFGEASFCWQAEVMAHMAARMDHLEQKIKPALADGQIVICDRYHDSTWAYQGFGMGAARPEVLSFIAALRQLVACEPDLTFLLDIPVDVAHTRLVKRGGKTDRYEGQASQFHQRVRDGFLQVAQQDPERVVVVDACASIEGVKKEIYRHMQVRLEGGGM